MVPCLPSPMLLLPVFSSAVLAMIYDYEDSGDLSKTIKRFAMLDFPSLKLCLFLHHVVIRGG